MKKGLKIGMVILSALMLITALHIIYNNTLGAEKVMSPQSSVDMAFTEGEDVPRAPDKPSNVLGELLSLATKPLTMPTALIALGACVLSVRIGKAEE